MVEISSVAHCCEHPLRASFKLLSVVPALAFALASLAVAVVLSAGPRSPNEIAAVFPPWWTPAQAFEAAGRAGAVTRVGGADSVMIVVSSDTFLAQRLYAEGALLLLDPVVTGLCGTSKEPGNV